MSFKHDLGETKERPPAPWFSYSGFIVAGPTSVTFAIAHKEGLHAVIDLTRQDISVSDCAEILKRYDIDRVEGTLDDCGGDALLCATAGALLLANPKERAND